MSSPILWTGISVLPYYNYIYLDIYCASSKINIVRYSGEVRREKLGGSIYSGGGEKEFQISWNHLPTTSCTCSFEEKKITVPTLIKPKSSICTCNIVDGTMEIDTILLDGSHLRNTLSTLLTFRNKSEKETDIIMDLSETCETQGHCVTVSTTKESGVKITTKSGFAAIIVSYLNDDHDNDNGFDGAEYVYPIVKTINGDYDIDEDFEYLLYNDIENLGWDESCTGLYGTRDIITTTNIKEGGMRI